MSQKGNEGFYLDKSGKKADAKIHDAILAEGDAEGAFQPVVRTLRRIGMDDATIERVYGMKIRKGT